MPAKNILLEEVEQLATPVILEHGAELVDLQFVHEHGQWVMRFFLDKKGGITLDDCADFSHWIGQVLDAADIIPQSYSLEISSPGIYRRLRKESDFKRFLGERIEVSMYAPVNGQRHFRGTLESAENGSIVVKEAEKKSHTLLLAEMAKATLDPEIQI